MFNESTPELRERLKASGLEEAVLNPTQCLIQKLTQVDRMFRDLALNPAALALQNYLMAGQTRLSSVNCVVKWQGDFGYGPQLGLHADQGATPTPWGPVAHTANSTWCLTDYTLAGGIRSELVGCDFGCRWRNRADEILHKRVVVSDVGRATVTRR